MYYNVYIDITGKNTGFAMRDLCPYYRGVFNIFSKNEKFEANPKYKEAKCM